jgi:DNA-binding response OmpR family regulator
MSPAAPEPRARRVLLADDCCSMRMMIAHTLGKGGFEVVMVDDGHLLREALKHDHAPRLVVTDWQMPGPSGVEICRELRERPGGDRFFIIVVTAMTDPDRLLEALDAGANDFVKKPFVPAELLARVSAGQRVLDLQLELEAAHEEVRALRTRCEGRDGQSRPVTHRPKAA